MIQVQCFLRRAATPFWHAQSCTIVGAELAKRGGDRPSIVAVYDAAEKLSVLKLWLTEPTDDTHWQINGIDLKTMVMTEMPMPASPSGEYVSGAYYECIVDSLDMRHLLVGLPDWTDMCIEVRFDPATWRGRIEDIPEWMGRVNWIEITPPHIIGGGPHVIRMEAPDLGPGENLPPMIRINGVWCYLYPSFDRQDRDGTWIYGGRWNLVADPRDLDMIRSYGHDIQMDKEPVPPRSRSGVRRLHRALPDGLDSTTYDAWLADVATLEQSILGITNAQGQLDLHQHKLRQLRAGQRHLEGLVNRRYRRRPKEAQAHTQKQWLEALKDDYAVDWARKAQDVISQVAITIKDCQRYDEYIEDRYEAYEAALDRCESREAEYADEIKSLWRISC